jgi:23S rRNA pseudouridine2605 synthase
MLVRLQKFLADAGIASRRASEEIIRAGRVSVNGRLVREMGTRIDPLHDVVTVDNVAVRSKPKHYVALHKPVGYMCSRRDPEGRRVVHELLPKEWGTLYTVGRLDYNTEGLIFLTNDGEFALRLTHPRYGISKRYQAVLEGKVEPVAIERITKGLFHEGERLKASRARLLKASRSHSLVELELTEGKNREVRRLFEARGLTVKALKRIQIGPIKLGELPAGKWRVLTGPELKSLLGTGGRKKTRSMPSIDRSSGKNFTARI